jgi:N-sulfoglucosamine sulfohydrolase
VIRLFGVWLGLLLASASGAQTNVLLIVADDLDWRSVGVYGSPIPDATPNIDRLAREGMRFERAYVTVSLCQPSRAVWMTGRYPHRNGAMGFDPIRPDVPTLVEALHAAGYRTGILGGLDHVVPTRIDAWDEAVGFDALGAGRNPGRYYVRSFAFLERARASKKPFFLMVNLGDAHRPFPGSDAETRLARLDYPTVPSYRVDGISVPAFLPDLPEIRRELARYQAAVSRADRSVGAVRGAHADAGDAGDTRVSFLSDNGMAMPFAKANCWDRSTRTPWIVRWPGLVRPGTQDAKHFVSGVDLAPTLLDAAGLPQLPGGDGRSFVPLLQGVKQAGRDHVFTQLDKNRHGDPFPMRAVRDASFGYIFNAWSDGNTRFRSAAMGGSAMEAIREAAQRRPALRARLRHLELRVPEELYDYRTDPDALLNLVADPAYATELKGLRGELLAQMERTQDPQLEAFRTRLRLVP